MKWTLGGGTDESFCHPSTASFSQCLIREQISNNRLSSREPSFLFFRFREQGQERPLSSLHWAFIYCDCSRSFFSAFFLRLSITFSLWSVNIYFPFSYVPVSNLLAVEEAHILHSKGNSWRPAANGKHTPARRTRLKLKAGICNKHVHRQTVWAFGALEQKIMPTAIRYIIWKNNI